jgi:hypothetical protein
MSAVTEFPAERTWSTQAPPSVWLRPDHFEVDRFRIAWNANGRTGLYPGDRSVPMCVAVIFAARMAQRHGCQPADPIVERLVALGVGR